MYDVFNNARVRGGLLNVTFDRFFKFPCKDNPDDCFSNSQLQTRTKYGNRDTMKDVTLRLATVVFYEKKI